MVKFLSSRCLATIWGFIQSCFLQITDTHTDTQTEEGLINYVVEMGSGAMICKPIFIIIGLTIQKLIAGLHRHTDNSVNILVSRFSFLRSDSLQLALYF
jgi:hypothetical protein